MQCELIHQAAAFTNGRHRCHLYLVVVIPVKWVLEKRVRSSDLLRITDGTTTQNAKQQ